MELVEALSAKSLISMSKRLSKVQSVSESPACELASLSVMEEETVPGDTVRTWGRVQVREARLGVGSLFPRTAPFR